MESEIQRLLHKGKDEGGRTVLEIIDYRRNEELLSKMREEQATVNKIQRATKYAEVGRWIENNLSDAYVKSHADSVSSQQHESKLWMVEEISKLVSKFDYTEPCHIEVVGSWFGWPLMEYIDYAFPNIKQVDLYDKDELCHPVMAQYKNKFEPKYPVHQFGDWFNRSDKRRRQVIINTSGEHMPHITQRREFFKGYPLVIVMSNDYFDGEGHTHCVNDMMELMHQQELGKVYYTGTRQLQTYNRYMVIGRMHAEGSD